MIHHRTFANFALVSNMLVAGPALTLIAGIISQLDQNQFSQWITHSNFHRFNHQLHTHAAPPRCFMFFPERKAISGILTR
ncbi:Uncharacterised protein [Shigella sonnei]|nr:Uncharacterised protein [Shigella sonnei]